MIVVTGATGHYGRKVVEGLSSRVPASELGVSVRDPGKAADFAAKGIRIEKASSAEPTTFGPAFDGAEQVLLVSADVLGGEAVRLHGSAITAAKAAGVKRILYTSHQAASPNSKVAFARDHAATVKLLKASGVDFVSLRNGDDGNRAFLDRLRPAMVIQIRSGIARAGRVHLDVGLAKVIGQVHCEHVEGSL